MRITSCALVFVLMLSCTNRKVEEKSVSEIHRSPFQKILFQRGDSIYLKQSDKKEQFVLIGFDPCISPNGKRMTYTKNGKDDNDFNRHIILVDLETKVEEKLNVENANFYGAIWSPDGEYIAFNIMTDNWGIGIIKSNNSDFKLIKGASENGLYSPTWSNDSKSVFAHDMVEIFEFDLNGKERSRLGVQETFGETMISSNSEFYFTSKKSGVFYNVGVADSVEVEGLDGPPEAILFYDLKSHQLHRISPKGFLVGYLNVARDSILVLSGSRDLFSNNIYQYNFALKNLKLLAKNGTNPTIAFID